MPINRYNSTVMKKKVTIRDIAREAGVSVATVSYVINDRQDQSISEETKQRVWHIVNLFNYEPNVFAKNLRNSPSSKFIAVYGGDGSLLKAAEYVNVLNSLRPHFDDRRYAVLFASRPYSRLDYADAIVACNVSQDDFRYIGKLNFIPLVARDCMVNDPVFFQINTDYAKLKGEADKFFDSDYAFVSVLPEDNALADEIRRTFANVVFVTDVDELESALRCGNVVTTEKLISDFAAKRGVKCLFSEQAYSEKAAAVANCLHKALGHEPFEEHFFKI